MSQSDGSDFGYYLDEKISASELDVCFTGKELSLSMLTDDVLPSLAKKEWSKEEWATLRFLDRINGAEYIRFDPRTFTLWVWHGGGLVSVHDAADNWIELVAWNLQGADRALVMVNIDGFMEEGYFNEQISMAREENKHANIDQNE